MNLPEYSLRSAKVIWFFLAVLLAGGALGFATLGKKEDAVFVIKSASLVCSYPGATPQQVEELVTEPIEREVQSMRRVHKITSESYYGLSKIQVELDPATPAAEIPQLWDELRRKVLNVQPRLPAGASAVTVADDFGMQLPENSVKASTTGFRSTEASPGPNCATGRSGSKRRS